MADGAFDVTTSIRDAAHQYGVDPAFALRVAHAESALNPAAISPKGALGVMQLMPGTASDMGVDPHDVRQNIIGGVKYLRQLSDKYDGDHELVAAAYNAGPGAVDKHGGVPPFPETQAYVAKVANDPVPTADDLEKHFAAGPGPVEQQDLPQVPGYISDPQNPEGGGVWGTKGVPIGGPSADDLEKHFGGPAAPAAAAQPPSPQQQAARRDLSTIDTALGQGLHIALHGPYGAGDTDTETPAIHGFTQGFSDELSGKVAGLATGAKNLVLDAMGKPIPYGMKDAEAAQTALSREKLAKIAQEHPIASATSEIAGGVLPWLAGGELLAAPKAVAAAPSAMRGVAQYGVRILAGGAKGAALGATGGAVTGFGNAEGTAEQRLPGAEGGAATGAVLGTALGAGLPAVAPVASKVAGYVGDELSAAGGAIKQGVSNALEGLSGRPVETTAREYFASRSPTAQKVQGTFAPADAAETVEPTEHETRLAQTRVAQMMAAKGMHPDDLREIATDIPHTTAEAIGSQTVNHLASLARRAGTTPDIAASQMAQRAEDFAPAIMDDFAAAAKIDPRQARVLNEDVTGTIHKDEVTPAYQAALDVDNPKPVMSARLAKLQEDPDIQSAVEQASRLVAKSGRSVSMVGPKIDPDTGAPVINPTTQEPVLEHQPTAEVWDQAKKIIDTSIVKRNGVAVKDGPEGVKNIFLGHAATDLREAIKESVPGYDKALAAASDELSRKAAYKLGSKTLFDQSTAKDLIDARAKMSPDELEAHTAGVANALFDKAQKNLLRPAVLRTPLFQAKVRAVLGDEADAFLARLEQRARLHATGGRIAPGAGSQTTPLLQASAESAPLVDALGNIVKEGAHLKANPLGFAIKHGLKMGDRASNIAETPGYRNAYGRILLQHPRATADELRDAPPIKPRLLTAHKVPVGAISGNVAGQRPGQ